MTNDVNKVIVGKPKVTGGILLAPVGSTLPTDSTTDLDVAFLAVGYAGDAGVTRGEKRDSSVKFAWGGDAIAITQKSMTTTAKLMLAEYLNGLVQSVIYGDANVTATAASSSHGNKLAIVATSAPCPRNAWIIEMISGEATVRLVFPDAQITDTDDVAYKDDDISARGVTLTLLPDENGAYFYEYSDDGQLT